MNKIEDPESNKLQSEYDESCKRYNKSLEDQLKRK